MKTKIIALLLLLVFSCGCEEILKEMGFLGDGDYTLTPKDVSYPPGENFVFSLSTDSAAYVAGSTVAISCGATSNNISTATRGCSGYSECLYPCGISRGDVLVWSEGVLAPGTAIPMVYIEETYAPGETKTRDYYWSETSAPGNYTVIFASITKEITIQ